MGAQAHLGAGQKGPRLTFPHSILIHERSGRAGGWAKYTTHNLKLISA